MAISNNSTGLRPGVCTSSTRPTAPYEGQTIYETDTDKTLFWNGSAWYPNWNTAWGIVGKSTLAAEKGFTAIEDLGLTVTWTAVATRQYKLSVFLNWDANAAANLQFFITDSANVALKEILIKTGGANFGPAASFVLVSGISGSVTYKVRGATSAGAATVFGATIRAALAAVFVVEDIGPA